MYLDNWKIVPIRFLERSLKYDNIPIHIRPKSKNMGENSY